MPNQSLQAIVGRALLDEDFRMDLFADPDETLASYRLTSKERAALYRIDAETLDVFAERLRTLLEAPDQSARRR